MPIPGVGHAVLNRRGQALLPWFTGPLLWLDEALSVNIARLPLGDIPGALRHDGAPPLYYVLLHLWMRVFGTGDGAVRALAARLCGWLGADPELRSSTRAGLVATVRERWSWQGVARGVIAAARAELAKLSGP